MLLLEKCLPAAEAANSIILMDFSLLFFPFRDGKASAFQLQGFYLHVGGGKKHTLWYVSIHSYFSMHY